MSDRVGIINHGRLLAIDTVAKLRAAHGYEFKITYSRNGSTADTETLYGTDDQELVERARAWGFNSSPSPGQTWRISTWR